MAKVKIKLLDSAYMSIFYIGETHPQETVESLRSKYINLPEFEIDGSGEMVAEYVYDMTNNHHKQEERLRLYGRGRSISVGDIVEVDGVEYLCDRFGWICLRESVS